MCAHNIHILWEICARSGSNEFLWLNAHFLVGAILTSNQLTDNLCAHFHLVKRVCDSRMTHTHRPHAFEAREGRPQYTFSRPRLINAAATVAHSNRNRSCGSKALTAPLAGWWCRILVNGLIHRIDLVMRGSRATTSVYIWLSGCWIVDSAQVTHADTAQGFVLAVLSACVWFMWLISEGAMSRRRHSKPTEAVFDDARGLGFRCEFLWEFRYKLNGLLVFLDGEGLKKTKAQHKHIRHKLAIHTLRFSKTLSSFVCISLICNSLKY